MGIISRLRALLSTNGTSSVGQPTSDEALCAELERFGPWTYPFQLSANVVTPLAVDWLAPSHETRTRLVFLKLDEIYGGRWQEISCLDIACNEGFFALEVSRRGARRVLGFDARQKNIDKAEFIKRHLGNDRLSFAVEELSNLTLKRFGTFDLTLCLGLLYHLENPMDALRRIYAVTKELCLIDTQVLRPTTPVTTAWITEDRLIHTDDVIGIIEEPDAVWNPAASVTGLSFVLSRSALLTMLRHAGFREVEEVPPYPGCFQPYATRDRIVLAARV